MRIEMTFDSLESWPSPAQSVANVLGVSNVIVGAVDVVVKPAGSVIVIVEPMPSVPPDDVVNPTVHVEAVLATTEVGAVPVKVTAEGADAAATATVVSTTENIATTVVHARRRKWWRTWRTWRASVRTSAGPRVGRRRRRRGCRAACGNHTGERRHREVRPFAGRWRRCRHRRVVRERDGERAACSHRDRTRERVHAARGPGRVAPAHIAR